MERPGDEGREGFGWLGRQHVEKKVNRFIMYLPYMLFFIHVEIEICVDLCVCVYAMCMML